MRPRPSGGLELSGMRTRAASQGKHMAGFWDATGGALTACSDQLAGVRARISILPPGGTNTGEFSQCDALSRAALETF